MQSSFSHVKMEFFGHPVYISGRVVLRKQLLLGKDKRTKSPSASTTTIKNKLQKEIFFEKA